MKDLDWIKKRVETLEATYIHLEQIQRMGDNSRRFSIEVANSMTVIEHKVELLEELAEQQLTEHPILTTWDDNMCYDQFQGETHGY